MAGQANGKNHCLGSQYTVDALWAVETALVWIRRKSVTGHVSSQGGGIKSAALATSTISLEVGTDLLVGKGGCRVSGLVAPPQGEVEA